MSRCWDCWGSFAAVIVAIYGLAFLTGQVAGRPVPVGSPAAGARGVALSRPLVAVMMVFLAFGMEKVFMFPWALVVTTVGPKAVVEMFIFLALLLVGVAYTWREEALRWV